MFQWLHFNFGKKHELASMTPAIAKEVVELNWQTEDGTIIKISAMSTSHLKNTINWIRTKNLSKPRHFRLMILELNRRGEKLDFLT